MSIFAVITNRTMKQNKARTIVTIIGVILATAMISAVITLGISLQRYMYEYAVETDGKWHVSAKGISDEDMKKMEQDENVKQSAVISEIGYAKVGENDESLFGQYLYVQSMDEKAARMLSVKLSQGRLPENNHEIVVPGGLQQNGEDIRIGDTVTFSIGDRKDENGNLLLYNAMVQYDTENNLTETFEKREERQFQVTGFLEHWGDTQRSGAGMDVFTGKGEETRTVSNLYIELKDPDKAFTFMETYQDVAVISENSSVLKWMGISGNESFKGMLNGMMTILIVIIGVGAVSLIYNAFSISLRERTTQFGLLSSVGATRRQLKRSMWQEALIVGMIGIPIGILSGIGGIGITLQFIGESMAQYIHGTQDGKITLQTSVGAVLMSALIAFLIICISVWIPAARIRRITPLEAIRANKDVKIRSKEVRSPKIIQKIFGLEGMLADKNYKRDRKKYRATVFSLTISIVLFTAATLFSGYMDRTGAFMLEAPEYELQYIASEEEMSKEEQEDLLQMMNEGKNVEKVDVYGYMSIPAGVSDEQVANNFGGEDSLENYYDISTDDAESYDRQNQYEYFDIVALPDEEFEEFASSQGVDASHYLQEGTKDVLFYDTYRFFNVDSKRYEKIHTLKGEEVAIQILTAVEVEEDMPASVEAIMDRSGSLVLKERVKELPKCVGGTSTFCTILIPESKKEMVKKEGSYDISGFTLYYQIHSSNYKSSYQDLKEKMEERGMDWGKIFNVAQRYEQDRGIRIALSILSFGFITLISLIASVNVFNTISTNIMLRKREFAMLKSMGMNMRSMKKMMNYECLIYGFRSIFYGVILSLLISLAMFLVLSQGAEIGFVQPWRGILISVLWVFAVVFATMLYSMSRIKKQNIIDELKKDS